MFVLLNTSILTAYGLYRYSPCTLAEARQEAQAAQAEKTVLSAIGHQSTADILSALLGVPVPMNRIQFVQEVGQMALIFKLRGRPEEGKVLSIEEIEAIGYDFGYLTRLEE